MRSGSGLSMGQSNMVLELARFVQRISAIARTGLAFSPNLFDAERYEELLREAAHLNSLLSEESPAVTDELFRNWRDSIGDAYDGYVTTAVGCGAIVFNSSDEILLIKRANGRWFYPGGFCDIGCSPAENVVREVNEETGLSISPLRLIAVTD